MNTKEEIHGNWWQQFANSQEETVYVLDTQQRLGGKVESCGRYGVVESVATAWERDPQNYITKYEPQGIDIEVQ